MIAFGEDSQTSEPPLFVEKSMPYIYYNNPGEYAIGRQYAVYQGGAMVFVKLTSIEVLEDHTLKLNFVWSNEISYKFKVRKHSDRKNKQMYIIDDLSNKYEHYKGSGAAYWSVTLGRRPKKGAFYFPPLNEGCKTITFCDDNQEERLGRFK